MNLEQLLQHREFLTSLARGLVQDPLEQEELIWETMGEGALRPPDHSALKPWLARVLIHRARARRRAERRRLRHEQAGSLPDRVESAAEVAARLELIQDLAAHVQALDTDSRDVVLFRFFENLPPREIAKRLDLPVEMVKQRLRRALALLRARLDKEHGSRDKWLGSLVPLAWPSAKVAGVGLTTAGLKTWGLETLGALMMTVKSKSVLVALTLLLLLAAGLLYAISDPGWPGAAGEAGIVELPASEHPPVEDGSSDEGRDPMSIASPSIASGRREQVEPMAEGGIQGRVVDQLSEPIAGAELFLYRARERERGAQAEVVASTRSNPRGEFRMRGLDHGLYSLRAVGEGSVDTWVRVLINKVSPQGLGLTLQLRDGYPLSGQVVDPDGKPLVGAWVLASVPSPVKNSSKGSEVRTDRKGRFAFPSLPRETLQVLAWSEGYALGLVEADAGSTRPLRIVLQRERFFSISFSLAEPKKVLGKMPGDVTVEARYFVGNATVPLPSPIRILSVPPKGKVRFPGLREGQYLFLPRSQQVSFEQTKIRQAIRRDEPAAEIELGWSAKLGLDVRLVDPVGKPVVGVLVSTPSAIDHVQRVVRSDEEGRLSFENLFRQGFEVALAVETPGYRFLIGKISSPWMRYNPGGAEHVLTFTPFPFLTGRVVDEEDEPVPGAQVWLRSGGSPGSFGRTRTDVHGEFRISKKRASKAPLVLDARRGTSYCEQPLLWETLDPASRKTVVLRLVEGASIDGRIVDEAGNGIPGVWAFARLLVRRNTSARRDPQRRGQRPDPRALSDRSGRFRIIGLEPAAWRISASMEGGIRLGEAPVVKILRGEKSAGLRLVLARGLFPSRRTSPCLVSSRAMPPLAAPLQHTSGLRRRSSWLFSRAWCWC